MQSHITSIRVYYEDTDAIGVVFYANYLKFAERGRTEFLRHLGFENHVFMSERGIAFVVRYLQADYFKPAHLDDALELHTHLIQQKNTSLVMKQSLFRGEEPIFSMDITLVCIDVKTQRPKRLPEDLKAAFLPYLTLKGK